MNTQSVVFPLCINAPSWTVPTLQATDVTMTDCHCTATWRRVGMPDTEEGNEGLVGVAAVRLLLILRLSPRLLFVIAASFSHLARPCWHNYSLVPMQDSHRYGGQGSLYLSRTHRCTHASSQLYDQPENLLCHAVHLKCAHLNCRF